MLYRRQKKYGTNPTEDIDQECETFTGTVRHSVVLALTYNNGLLNQTLTLVVVLPH